MVVAASVLFVPGAPARHEAPRCGPFLLVQLPALGTLTWRTTTRDGKDWHGLAYKPTPPIATTALRLRVGGGVVRRTVNEKPVVLPLYPNRYQLLTLSQMTEPGTLRASVRVDFKPGVTYTYCAPYMPPGLSITLRPRS
jgi:hypothetical protein